MSLLASPETLLSNQWQAYNPPKLSLDFLSTPATAAYSVRKIRGTYAGACMNVRRSSDNATQDIGFTATNDFDIVAFSAFIGSGSGFIHTWYDQSGNGHHATQATAANQPQLAPGITPTGKAGAQASSGGTMLAATIPAATLPVSFSILAERTGNLNAFNVPISQGNNFPCLFFDAAPNIGIANANIDGIVGPAPDNVFHTALGINTGGPGSQITVDGVTATPASLSSHPGSTNLYLMASDGTPTGTLFGALCEAIYFDAALSAGDITQLNNDQTSYYLTVAAANALTNSIGTVSSLDTGVVGTFTAWGSIEYGYAYTYTLAPGAPAGVSIDSDIGALSIATPLAAGTYTLGIVARNRENSSLVATFPYNLVVAQGVTSGRTGTQILHTTYAPDSGTWGTPTAGDWTAVLHAMVAQIISDQTAAGDGLLHATILLRRNTTYFYTDNAWMNGIQYYVLRDDPGFPSGTIPALCNTYSVAHDFDSKYQIINAGTGSAMLHQADGIKNKSAQIQTCNPGDTSVTLVNTSDGSRLIPGRWHLILGQQTQIGGYPPNCAWNEYVKVVSVSGTTVTLDRPLRYRYDRNWYEDPGNNPDQNFGGGYIVPWDIGGSGGTVTTDGRMTVRSYWLNLNCVKNPNISGSTENVVEHQCFIDLIMENCTLPNPSPTMLKHIMYKNCSITVFSEPDKQCETDFYDGCSVSNIGGATGFMYLFARNTAFSTGSLSPRQLRLFNCTFDPTIGASGGNAGPFDKYGVPFALAGPGPIMYFNFDTCTFKRSHWGGQWSWAANLPNTTHVGLGTDAAWLGSELQIPATSAQFQSWIGSVYEGLIICEGLPPISTNWGYIDSMAMDVGGHNLLLNVIWVNGTRPTQVGTNLYAMRNLRLKMTNVTLDPTSPPGALAPGPTYWQSPGFVAEDSGGLATPIDASGNGGIVSNWTYPTGYPSRFHQFPITPAGPCLLDTIPGATAAYSVRRLRRAFTGNPVQVRRASDNTTQDIGFLGDDFNITQMVAFVGGSGTAYVSKWYDQIGTQDAVQATNANQPILANNVEGLVDTGFGSGKPTVTSAGGTGILLAATLSSAAPAAITLSAVVGRTGLFTATNVPLGLWTSGADNKPGIYFANSANGGLGLANLNGATLGPFATADSAFHAVLGITNGASSKVVVDGWDTLHGGTITGTLAASAGGTTINIMSDNGASPFAGNIAEAIYFAGVLSDPNVTALQASQNTYFVHIPLPADAVPNAIAGYSTRRVSENHANTAPCIRLQRSSDNAQIDIGFDPATRKVFDHATYAAWAAGGGTITVVKWYDQVGSADMIPMDTTNPPTFVDAITPSGVPALYNNGATFSGLTSSIPAENTPLTMTLVCNRTGNFGTVGSGLNADASVAMAFYGGPPADADHMPGMTYIPGAGEGMVVTELRYSSSVPQPCPDNTFVSSIGRAAGGESRTNIDGAQAGGSTGMRVGATVLNLLGPIRGQGTDVGAYSPLTGYVAEAFYHFGSISDAQVAYLRATHISYFGTRTSNLLLDYITGAVAAYSLRLLRTAYTGFAVQVRRSSDNTTLNIGFDANGDFDVATFNTFVGTGGGIGYVVTWYDQSGNNANATQANTALQPQIALGVSQHGKAGVQFQSANTYLSSTIPAATLPLTLVGQAGRTATAGGSHDTFVGLGNNAPGLFYGSVANTIGLGNVGIDSIIAVNELEPYQHTVQGIMASAASKLLVDGGPTLGTLSDHPGSTVFSIGLSGTSMVGYVSEVLYYPRAFIDAEIDSVQTSLNTYY